jgi:D-glycero-D-manno-heptose 1,7-bisphosphate phosphatase
MKLVILDRDGTINADSDEYIKSPEEWQPLPGLFEQIGERLGVDLKGTPVVGDGLRDLQAGAALGCEPHLVLTGKGAALRGLPLPSDYPAGTQVHEDLGAFADYLIARGAASKPAA